MKVERPHAMYDVNEQIVRYASGNTVLVDRDGTGIDDNRLGNERPDHSGVLNI